MGSLPIWILPKKKAREAIAILNNHYPNPVIPMTRKERNAEFRDNRSEPVHSDKKMPIFLFDAKHHGRYDLMWERLELCDRQEVQ